MTRPAHPAPRELVLRFLETIGPRADAEYYLSFFKDQPAERFAMVGAHPAVIQGALASFTEQLQFLAELGLYAPIVLGLTDPTRAESDAERLEDLLPQAGLKPRAYRAERDGLPSALKSDLVQGRVPIVYYRDGSKPVSRRFEHLAELRRTLACHKIVLLRPQGGLTLGSRPPRSMLRDRGLGNRLSLVSLRNDYERLKEPGALEDDDQRLLGWVRKLLEGEVGQAVVSIASPLNLLRELFTVKGAGTLIRTGSEIASTNSYEKLDQAKLQALLESTFGKRLIGDLFARPVSKVYYEEGLRGVAVIEPDELAPFLSKFAVERLAQGEGIGRDLWEALSRDHERLFWRARPDNPITAWYASHCDGMTVTPDWRVYWRGLDPSEIPRAIEDACARPRDFD